MNYLIDIGVNLTGSSFKKDLPEVIQRAEDAGVRQMVVTGTNIEHSRTAVELDDEYSGVLYSTAGVHPHHAKDCNDQTLITLSELAQHPSVVAIGECGLDFNRNFSPAQDQLKWFEAQLELAADHQLPVFLHQRDAHDDFLKIMQYWRPKLVGAVAHCFTGSTDEALAYIDLDMYIGVTGWICDERRGGSLQQAVQHIPANRIMLETDAPYLLPRDLEPKPRDKRNEPMYLPHVCQAVARYREESLDHLAQVTTENAQRFFKLASITT